MCVTWTAPSSGAGEADSPPCEAVLPVQSRPVMCLLSSNAAGGTQTPKGDMAVGCVHLGLLEFEPPVGMWGIVGFCFSSELGKIILLGSSMSRPLSLEGHLSTPGVALSPGHTG